MNKIIDAKGKNCPIPVMMAKKEIDNGNIDFVVEVDNKIANENLKKLGNSMNL
ncbi:selenium metabolism protein YedF [Clostridioides difficile]|nr:selenium metabolism protein YedF [Clostridioides difficile]